MSHSNGPRTGRPPIFASRGMVSTPHYLASTSGLDALRRGGTAVDAAKIIRERGYSADDLARDGVSLRERLVSDGLALAKLDDGLFERVATGQMPVERGVAVANAVESPAEQRALLQFIEQSEGKGRPITPEVITELARQVRSAGTTTRKAAGPSGHTRAVASRAGQGSRMTARPMPTPAR